MTLIETAGRALRQGLVGAVLTVSLFVVLTDVVRFAFAQEVGALLFVLALPWPIVVGAVAGVTKTSGLVALLLGLSLNWMVMQLLRAWRRRARPTSLFGDRDG